MHSADYNSITNSKVQTSDHMLFSESATSLKKMLVSKSMTAYKTLNDSKKLNVGCFAKGGEKKQTYTDVIKGHLAAMSKKKINSQKSYLIFPNPNSPVYLIHRPIDSFFPPVSGLFLSQRQALSLCSESHSSSKDPLCPLQHQHSSLYGSFPLT